MLALAEKAKKDEEKSDIRIEKEREVKDQLKRAFKQREEEMDEVKAMNRRVQYAVTVAVRDKQ